MIITSVTQKNVLSTVVIHYFAWYVFLRDRRYCYAKFPFNFVDKIISKSNRRPRWPLHCESGYFKLIYHVRIESIFFLSKTKKCPTLLNLPNDLEMITYALSFYRSQNVLCWSKFFEPDQKFIYVLCQSQTFCARTNDDLHTAKLFFVSVQNFWRGTKCSQIFGLAQNIWTDTKHFGTCKRTRH